MNRLRMLLQAEDGIQHAEEALLLGLIALAALGALSVLGSSVEGRFAAAAEGVAAASDG